MCMRNVQVYVDYRIDVVAGWTGSYDGDMFVTLHGDSEEKTHRITLPKGSAEVRDFARNLMCVWQ